MSRNNVFEVKSPCTESWDEMSGGDHVRFCSHCAKSVNNISAMTRKEAMRLVRSSGGSICVRYEKHPAKNAPIFAPRFVQIAGRKAVAAGILGASIAMATPAYAQGGTSEIQIVRTDQKPKPDGSTAKISGYITDPNGAVIPYALVSITNKETSEYRTANSSAEGFYEFANLPGGNYTVKVEAGGFEAQEMPNVYVSEAGDIRRDASLAIPQIAEVVQVGGERMVAMGAMAFTGLLSIVDARNALVQAVMNEDLEEVKVRVMMRAKVNVKDKSYDGITPLHAAVETGNVEIVQYLLSRGAKINIRDFQKRTPLMMLDDDASPELFQLLVTYGAKLNLVDKSGNNVLHHFAAYDGKADMIRILITNGVNINAVNKEGKTALMIAAENESESNLKALIESGADVNAMDRQQRSAGDLTDSDAIKTILEANGGIARRL